MYIWGHADGPQNQMDSHRGEAYGLMTAIILIKDILHLRETTNCNADRPNITIYSDADSVLKKLSTDKEIETHLS